jgi:hypothetical protein
MTMSMSTSCTPRHQQLLQLAAHPLCTAQEFIKVVQSHCLPFEGGIFSTFDESSLSVDLRMCTFSSKLKTVPTAVQSVSFVCWVPVCDRLKKFFRP